jgi:glutaredoxin
MPETILYTLPDQPESESALRLLQEKGYRVRTVNVKESGV